MVSAADGSMSGGLLLNIITGFPGGDAGGTSVPHHLQFGRGRSGPTLDISGGRERGQVGQERTGGQTPKHPPICG